MNFATYFATMYDFFQIFPFLKVFFGIFLKYFKAKIDKKEWPPWQANVVAEAHMALGDNN